MFALKGGPAFVIRMNCKGDVPHDGLGTCCGDFQIGTRFLHDFIANLVEFALLRLHDDLLVRQRGEADGTPVDHALTTINVAPFIEFYECVQDSP